MSAAVRGFLLTLHLHFYLCFTMSYAFLVLAYLCKRHISCVLSTSEEEARPSKCNVIPNDGFSFLLDLILITNPHENLGRIFESRDFSCVVYEKVRWKCTTGPPYKKIDVKLTIQYL